MKILLATTNKAKIRYYGTKLREKGIDLITLNDLGINIEVNETGENPIENALIKARSYQEASHLPTIALDDGLFLENIPNELQPGTHVRRVGTKKLSDQEMIEYYIGLVNQYGIQGKLNGFFLKGVAIVDVSGTYTFDLKVNRCFVNYQSMVVDEGYPLASIQKVFPLNKFKSELTEEEEKATMDIEQKGILEFILKTIQRIENKEPKELVKI